MKALFKVTAIFCFAAIVLGDNLGINRDAVLGPEIIRDDYSPFEISDVDKTEKTTFGNMDLVGSSIDISTLAEKITSINEIDDTAPKRRGSKLIKGRVPELRKDFSQPAVFHANKYLNTNLDTE